VCKGSYSASDEELPVKGVNKNRNPPLKFGFSMDGLKTGLTAETASLLGINSSMDRFTINTENLGYYE
jgi:hypothetical protein